MVLQLCLTPALTFSIFLFLLQSKKEVCVRWGGLGQWGGVRGKGRKLYLNNNLKKCKKIKIKEVCLLITLSIHIIAPSDFFTLSKRMCHRLRAMPTKGSRKDMSRRSMVSIRHSFPRDRRPRFLNSCMLITSGMFDKIHQSHYLHELGRKKKTYLIIFE